MGTDAHAGVAGRIKEATMAIYRVWIQSVTHAGGTICEYWYVEMSPAQADAFKGRLDEELSLHRLSDYKLDPPAVTRAQTAAERAGRVISLAVARAEVRSFITANPPHDFEANSLWRLDVSRRSGSRPNINHRNQCWWIAQMTPTQKAKLIRYLDGCQATGELHSYTLELETPPSSSVNPNFELAFACPYNEFKKDLEAWLGNHQNSRKAGLPAPAMAAQA
jgi:hypothetical protein